MARPWPLMARPLMARRSPPMGTRLHRSERANPSARLRLHPVARCRPRHRVSRYHRPVSRLRPHRRVSRLRRRLLGGQSHCRTFPPQAAVRCLRRRTHPRPRPCRTWAGYLRCRPRPSPTRCHFRHWRSRRHQRLRTCSLLRLWGHPSSQHSRHCRPHRFRKRRRRFLLRRHSRRRRRRSRNRPLHQRHRTCLRSRWRPCSQPSRLSRHRHHNRRHHSQPRRTSRRPRLPRPTFHHLHLQSRRRRLLPTRCRRVRRSSHRFPPSTLPRRHTCLPPGLRRSPDCRCSRHPNNHPLRWAPAATSPDPARVSCRHRRLRCRHLLRCRHHPNGVEVRRPVRANGGV